VESAGDGSLRGSGEEIGEYEGDGGEEPKAIVDGEEGGDSESVRGEGREGEGKEGVKGRGGGLGIRERSVGCAELFSSTEVAGESRTDGPLRLLKYS